MKSLFVLSAVLATAIGLVTAADRRPVLAMSSNCSDPGSMMMKAHDMIAQTKPVMTGDVDKDFVAMEVIASKAQIVMARTELQCGSTAAGKASAGALLRESEERLRLFRNQGTSL